MKACVPPVDRNFTPFLFSSANNSSSPSLWKTEINAFLIFLVDAIIVNCILYTLFELQNYKNKLTVDELSAIYFIKSQIFFIFALKTIEK